MINQKPIIPITSPNLAEAKQPKNLIISVVVVLLIIGGLLYYQKRNKEKVVSNNTEDTTQNDNLVEDNKIPIPEPGPTKEELLQKKVSEANATELKAQETARKAKWNTAMKNAQVAFGKGEYDKSITFYNEALSYQKTDTGYSGLFFVYSAQNNIDQARVAIDAAIKLNPLFTDYWKEKLTLLDYKTNVSYIDLKNIYTEGLTKVDIRTKINLVTYFAVIAENNREYKDAISSWEYAKSLYPQNKSIYQGEIDRLSKL